MVAVVFKNHFTTLKTKNLRATGSDGLEPTAKPNSFELPKN